MISPKSPSSFTTAGHPSAPGTSSASRSQSQLKSFSEGALVDPVTDQTDLGIGEGGATGRHDAAERAGVALAFLLPAGDVEGAPR